MKGVINMINIIIGLSITVLGFVVSGIMIYKAIRCRRETNKMVNDVISVHINRKF
jgi:hypothetical protein